jgi:hypothetical protein
MTQYPISRYELLLKSTFLEIENLGTNKGGEYAGDGDRLANFRRNGENLGLPMETVWAVYAGKHWDAIQQYIKDQRNGKERLRLEPIEGRVDDLITYLILFKAMLDERENYNPATKQFSPLTAEQLEGPLMQALNNMELDIKETPEQRKARLNKKVSI